MQVYRPFFPNFPPPPVPSRASIINEGLRAFEQVKLDQQWSTSWIERKKERISSNRITLSDYRQKLIHHAHLLQQYAHALNNSNHEILLELKNKIEQSNTFIYDSQMINHMQKAIRQRRSKRVRLRRQKEEKLIDTKPDIIENQPRNEKSLAEKIQDINSLLQTIEKLKQLKNLRQQQNDDSNTTTFDEFTEVHNVCTAKLLEYQSQMERESRGPQIDSYNYLFNNDDRSFYESMHSDAQYFLRAHQNVSDLVQIRQAWDQYSRTQMSSLNDIIPSQWHEPQVPSDSNWARYLSDRKE